MRIHFVQMRLGEICVGMIHKFVLPKKKEDQDFSKRHKQGKKKK